MLLELSFYGLELEESQGGIQPCLLEMRTLGTEVMRPVREAEVTLFGSSHPHQLQGTLRSPEGSVSPSLSFSSLLSKDLGTCAAESQRPLFSREFCILFTERLSNINSGRRLQVTVGGVSVFWGIILRKLSVRVEKPLPHHSTFIIAACFPKS